MTHVLTHWSKLLLLKYNKMLRILQKTDDDSSYCYFIISLEKTEDGIKVQDLVDEMKLPVTTSVVRSIFATTTWSHKHFFSHGISSTCD